MNLVSPKPANRPAHIPEAEWRVRTDLAAFYRLVHHQFNSQGRGRSLTK